MKRIIPRVLLITLLTTFLGGVMYYQGMEATLGLDNLFKIRGTRTPPNEITLVTMDEISQEYLGMKFDLKQWRKYHAKVVQELNRKGAAFIIFDLQFLNSQAEQDTEFVNVIKAAGNVLVTECTTLFDANNKFNSGRDCSEENLGRLSAESDKKHYNPSTTFSHTYNPIAAIEQAVLDHAPFILPDIPGSETIRETWIFTPGQPDETLKSTLPLTIWLYYLEQTGALQTLTTATFPLSMQPHHPWSKWLAESRRICLNALVAKNIDLPSSNLHNQLIILLCGEDNSRYIDFYGPAKTFNRLSYKDVYAGNTPSLDGKIVFVGLDSQYLADTGKDNFTTPFTDVESGRTYGLEIMATQFANLLENRTIYLPFSPVLALAGYALVISLIMTFLPVLYGISTTLLISTGYFALALALFSRHGIWLPVAVPILIQLPIIWMAALLWSRWDLLGEKAELINSFPDAFEAWNSPENNEKLAKNEETFGLCLASDIIGYTNVAANHTPTEIRKLLIEYHYVLGLPVKTNQGIIADATGDAMMAIWVDSSIDSLRFSACMAALDIQKEVARFNDRSAPDELPTRIGIHEGKLILGELNKENRVFGDTLVIASRIEGVNKLLNTKILASTAVVKSLPTICYRPVGSFLLRGLESHGSFELVELVGLMVNVDAKTDTMHQLFENGLHAFKQGQWQIASHYFQNCLDQVNNKDGPSLYYLKLARAYLNNPPTDWNGYIALS